jgi:HEAT repeat protein
MRLGGRPYRPTAPGVAARAEKGAQALGLIGDVAAAKPLIASFAHPIGNLRREIVAALDALQTPKAAPIFEEALSDSDIEVQKAAARA